MKMLKRLDVVHPDAIVVQIGCGIGRIERHLHRYVRFCYGIDIAPSMIEQARSNVQAENVCFICARQLNALPISRCDLVYSIFVFQHLPRERTAGYLRDSFALLAPGGKLVFQILVDDAGVVREPPRRHPYGLRSYRRAELATLLENVGFVDVRLLAFPTASPDLGAAGDLLVTAAKPST